MGLENLEGVTLYVCDNFNCGKLCGNRLYVIEGAGIITTCGHCGANYKIGPDGGYEGKWRWGMS